MLTKTELELLQMLNKSCAEGLHSSVVLLTLFRLLTPKQAAKFKEVLNHACVDVGSL